MAGKIDTILKLSVVASVLLASSSVGYYYLVDLPQRDEPQRVLERFRAAAEKRAEQEQLLFEQKVSERRVVEQQAVEERQASERLIDLPKLRSDGADIGTGEYAR